MRYLRVPGIAKEKKGDLNAAMADYDQAIKISPKFSDPYIGSKFLLAAKTGSVADRYNYLDIIKLRKLRHDLRLRFKRSFHAQRGRDGSKRSCKGCFRSVQGPAPIAQNVV
jgi:hypothetical protein